MIEKNLEKIEKDIKNQLSEMLDKIHKHSIDDHIMSLECDLIDMIKKEPETVKSNFEIMLGDTIYHIFEDVSYQINYRIKSVRDDVHKKMDKNKK